MMKTILRSKIKKILEDSCALQYGFTEVEGAYLDGYKTALETVLDLIDDIDEEQGRVAESG